MIDPHDIEGLGEAMRRILVDAELRASLVQKGLKQVQKFNWHRVARNTLAVYYEVSQLGKPGTESRDRLIPQDLWLKYREVEKSFYPT